MDGAIAEAESKQEMTIDCLLGDEDWMCRHRHMHELIQLLANNTQ
jgi:hypothetical protein